MPHRRRHSWPACVPERTTVPVITVSQPQEPPERQFLAPLVSAELLESDDAASAGIVRSGDHSGSSSATRYRLWPHYHHHKVVAGSRTASARTDASMGSPLRRMLRPPLDKARSLFVLPTTTTAGEKVVLSYWVPQSVPSRPSLSPLPSSPLSPALSETVERGRPVDAAVGRLRAEGNHRRCHSEQPRSWREPSASLWTLSEE
ncbi:hypothetical protein P168DRAFT_292790 [Aspergillus campestris IBT 28561]|uniref:Uncharacterized protein n=1 Tax=Aspergillus campestris (strain IBT 28561) TaxID=1392248 RepID=A0A2I1CVR7_ASPC2|nr:uncharacterized protein P168DRAFT_292790 [Aspergillus campestris IBT 28561]PKY01705.1 hypothetical protein P168DRAFT_292790 [Aspergillus campestris IBT 28561]